MILATINNKTTLFDTWREFHTATFSPAAEVSFVTDFVIRGSDYQSRKEAARDLAIMVQLNDCGGLSWGECSILQDIFTTLGQRYGLLTEFRENCII